MEFHSDLDLGEASLLARLLKPLKKLAIAGSIRDVLQCGWNYSVPASNIPKWDIFTHGMGATVPLPAMGSEILY